MKNDKPQNDGRNKITKKRKIQNALRKGKLQVLENIGSRHHQTSGDERKKEYPRRTRKRLGKKLYSKKPFKWKKKQLAVLLERYSGTFLKWTREELKQMDLRQRKLMTMPFRNDIDGLYVSGKVGGKRLASTANNFDISIRRLKNYTKKNK